MREEELINHFGKEERYSNNYSNFIDQDALAKNDFYHYKKGYELGINELETTKKLLDDWNRLVKRYLEGDLGRDSFFTRAEAILAKLSKEGQGDLINVN